MAPRKENPITEADLAWVEQNFADMAAEILKLDTRTRSHFTTVDPGLDVGKLLDASRNAASLASLSASFSAALILTAGMICDRQALRAEISEAVVKHEGEVLTAGLDPQGRVRDPGPGKKWQSRRRGSGPDGQWSDCPRAADPVYRDFHADNYDFSIVDDDGPEPSRVRRIVGGRKPGSEPEGT